MAPSSSDSAAAPRGAAMEELTRGRRFALIVGIDAYENGVTPLSGAAADATAVAEILRSPKRLDRYEFEDVTLLTDREATRAGILGAFASLRERVGDGRDAHLVVYYAGHGIGAASPEEATAETPGYFLPQDAVLGRDDTFLSMKLVRETLNGLNVHHLLLVLDCCFAGAFRWAGTRAVGRPQSGKRSIERFRRYLREPSWTVITSAAQDERALDTIDGKVMLAGSRGGPPAVGAARVAASSPFAIALGEALSGEADVGVQGASPDGVITAAELHFYITQRFDRWEREMGGRRLQKPMMFPWPDKANVKGEFVFVNPKVPSVELESAGPLLESHNPYRGLRAHEYVPGGDARRTYFGREALSKELFDKVTAETAAHVLVLGPSGSGKTSLVAAGLLPLLEAAGWDFCKPWRPGEAPERVLQEVVAWLGSTPRRAVVVIDQLEELATLPRRGGEATRAAFFRTLREAVSAAKGRLRVVYVLRSDHEPQFAPEVEALGAARVHVTPMSRKELREAIEGPAERCVLQFSPPELVDRIVAEVADAPGALPLLSFTLGEMYLAYVRAVRDGRDVRALQTEDYEKVGGVAGSLSRRAEEVFAALGDAQADAREVLLRAVSPEGGGTRRRLHPQEIRYDDAAKSARVDRVINGLVEAQLMVVDVDAKGEARYEFAHNSIVRQWPRLQAWVCDRDERERLEVRQRLREKVDDWNRQGRTGGWLDGDPRLHAWKAALAGQLNADEAALIEGSYRRLKRNSAIVLSVVATAFAAMLAVAIYAVKQRHDADKQRLLAVRTAGELLQQQRATLRSERQAREEATKSQAAALRARIEVPGHELAELADALALVGARPQGSPRGLAGVDETLLLATLTARRTTPLAAAGCAPGSARFTRDGDGVSAAATAGATCGWDARSGQRLPGLAAPWCDAAAGSGYALLRPRVGPGSFDEAGVVRLVPPTERPPFAARAGAPCALRHDVDVLGDADAAFVEGTRRRRVVVRRGLAELFDEDTNDPGRRPRAWRVPASRGQPVELAGFSPDGRLLFTSDGREQIALWEPPRRRPLRALQAWASGAITAITVSPSGRWLFAASDVAGRTVGQLYGVAPGDDDAEPRGKVFVARSVARAWFVEEGDTPRVALVLADGSAAVVLPIYRDWAFGMSVATEPAVDATVLDVAQTGDGARFLLEAGGSLVTRGSVDARLVTPAAADGAWRLRRLNTADARFTEGAAPSVLLRSLDGRSALAVFDDHLSLWQTDAAAPSRRAVIPRAALGATALPEDPRRVDFALLSPERLRLAAAVGDTLVTWEINPQGVQVSPPHTTRLPWPGDTLAIALSPGGDRVAVTTAGDRAARLVDVADGAHPVVLTHERGVSDAAFSADGARVVTASDDALRFWDAAGAPLATVPSGLGVIYQAALVGAGASEHLVTLSADGGERVWSIAPAVVRRAACDRLRGEPTWDARADVRAACAASTAP